MGSGMSGVSIRVDEDNSVPLSQRERRDNHEAFLERLIQLEHPVELMRGEDRCYSLAKSSHRGQFRDSERDAHGNKLRFFEHPRTVEKILTNECKEQFRKLPLIIQATLVCAAYVHDMAEDTLEFYNSNVRIPGETCSRREAIKLSLDVFDPRNIEILPETVFDGLKDKFNPQDRLSTVVMGVTKFTSEELDSVGYTKDHSQFKRAKNILAMANVEIHGPGAAVIKASDRLANLRTMDNFTPERVNKLISETKEFIIPCLMKFSKIATGRFYAPLIKNLIKLLNNEMNKHMN